MAKLKITLLLIILFTVFLTGIQSQEEKSIEDVHGLSVGEKAPLFAVLDADSNLFILRDALSEGPVVLIFYRGFWCPVCNKHLGSIQDSLKMIEQTGLR